MSEMERGSAKVGPRLDDELKHDTEGLVRGGHDTRAEESRGSEPSGEDQPRVALVPELSAADEGYGPMSRADIETRAELASYVGRAGYPLGRQELLELVTGRQAPDHIVDMVSNLPAGELFESLDEVWRTVGGASEGPRT